MSGTQASGESRPFFSRSRRHSRLERFFLGLVLIALPVGLYFFTVINGQLRQERERAARSLAETEQRVGNLLTAAMGLQSAKEGAALNVDGLQAAASGSGDVHCPHQAQSRYLSLRPSRDQGGYGLTFCERTRAVVEIDLDHALREGRHLREFDLLTLSTHDGELIAFHGGEPELLALRQSAQRGERVSGVARPISVQHLLQLARASEIRQSQIDLAADNGGETDADGLIEQQVTGERSLEFGVVQLRHSIGDTRYRLTIKSYPLPAPLYRVDPTQAGDTPDARPLVLIGFREVGDWNLPDTAIDPFDAWLLGAFALAAVLIVPLVRLLLLEVHDSLTRHHARAIAFSAVALAGLLTISVLSVTAHQSLTGLLRIGAARYATELNLALRAEIQSVLTRMDQHRRYYAARDPRCSGEPTGKARHPARSDSWPDGRLEICTQPGAGTQQHAHYARITPAEPGSHGVGSMHSPLSSTVLIQPAVSGVANLGSLGLTYGPCAAPLPPFNVGDREYHRMLAQDRAWHWHWSETENEIARHWLIPDLLGKRPVPDTAECRALIGAAGKGRLDAFVAQRLFNRRNGGKLMQFAAAMPGDDFAAAITGSAPMLAFTAAVPPLLYGFVVFDRSSGLVVLHDDDQRSLVENLYVETERSAQLLAAVRAGQSAPFEGRYRGTDHLFHYQPVAGTGWGLLVTYPTQPLGAAILHASLTAVTVGGGWLAIMFVLYLAVLRLTNRQTNWAWPQWRLRNAYGYLALLLTAFLVLQALALGAVGRAKLVGVVVLGGSFIAATAFALLSSNSTRGQLLRWLMLLGACASSLGVAIFGGLAQISGFTLGAILVCESLLLLMLLLAWRRISAQTLPPADAWAAPPPFGLGKVRTASGYARGYTLCAALMLAILAVLPMTATFMHAYGWQVDALNRSGLLRTLAALETRHDTVDRWLRREIPDPALRRSQYPDGRPLSLALPMPGLLGFDPADAGPQRENAPACLLITLFTRLECFDKGRADDHLQCLRPAPQAADGLTDLLTAACNPPAISPGGKPPPTYDALHWVARGLAITSERSATARLLTTMASDSPVHRTRAGLAGSPWVAVRVTASQPDGHSDAAVMLLRPRGLPLPEYGQAGPLRWGPMGWMVVAMLAIGVPLYLLITVTVRRLTGLDRDAGLWAERRPRRSERYTQMIRRLEQRCGSAPRLLGTDESRTSTPSADPASPDAEQALDGLAALLESDDPRAWIRLDAAPRDADTLPDHGPVLLTGLDEAVAGDREQRQRILHLLEDLVRSSSIKIFLLSDFSLVRKLSHDIGYPSEDLAPDTSPDEAGRWLILLSRMRWWPLAEHIAPENLSRHADAAALYDHIDEECTVLWPKLETLRRALYMEVDTGRIRHQDQIEARVLAVARPLLRRMWKLSSVSERLALFQLAGGRYPNPRNAETLRNLFQRGLLRYRPGPSLVSGALRRYTLEAEPPSVFSEWQLDAADGAWKSLRGPIMLILLLLFAALSYSSGHALAALAAGITSSLGVIGALLSAMNLIRLGGGTQK